MQFFWRTLLCVYVCVLSTTARAENNPLQNKFRDLQSKVQEVGNLLQGADPEKQGEQLAKSSEKGLDLVGETIDEIKNGIDASLKSLYGKAEPKEVPSDPRFPFKVNHNTPTLLRANIIQGNVAIAGNLLELAALNVRLVSDWLTLAQGAAMSKGRKRLPFGDFKLIREQLNGAVDTAQKLFPTLPAFPLSTITKEGKREIPNEKVSAFLSFFARDPEGKNLDDGMKKNVMTLLQVMDAAYINVDSYYYAYPQKGNEAALRHFTGAIGNLPGFHECVNLSRGLGDFDGQACKVKEFREGLTRYIDFYDKNSGASSNLISTLLEFFASFEEAEGDKLNDKSWEGLKKDLDWHVQHSKFHAKVKERWPEVRDAIFVDTKKLTELLKEGAALHAFFKDLLNRYGLTPRFGFEDDYFENVEGAKLLLKRFDEQRGDKAPDTLERIDSATSCKIFLDKDTANSPWTLNTLVSAEMDPRAEASATGYQRIIWLNEVKMGNAVAIQNSQVADRMLAGLSIRTAVAMIVPNIVHTQMLLGNAVGDDITDLGLKKAESDTLGTVERHYRLPSWKKVISASRDAFWTLMQSHAEGIEEKGDWKDEVTRNRVTEDFRKTFREAMKDGGTQIREVNASIAKVKSEAAKMADPAISTILQIPTDFTGEYDPRIAAQINDSLINTMLPAIMQDYIKRKWPDTRTNRELRDQKYRELRSVFTIDQFMDQLDWYWGMDLVRQVRAENFLDLRRTGKRGDELPPKPLRRPDFIGYEELKLLWEFPVISARLLNHTMDSYQRKLDYLEYAQKRLYYSFPALKFGDAWKTYDDSRFTSTMEIFLKNAVDEANRVLALKKTPEVLDYFVPNLPLMDMVLKSHPDQKLKLCEEQKDRKIWDERMDTILSTTAMAATAAAYVPVLAPVGIAVDGVVLVIDGIRAYHKYRDFARAEAWVFAASTQMSSDEVEHTQYGLRQLEMIYTFAVAKTAVNAALLAPAVALKIPPIRMIPFHIAKYVKAVRRAVSVVRSEMRAARAVEEAAVKAAFAKADAALWFANHPSRFARVLDFLNKTRHKMMSPFMRLGLAERWTHKSLFQRFYENFAFRRAHRFAGNVPGLAKDLFLQFPWSLMGYQWGSGVLAKAFQFYSLSEMSLWIMHSIRNVNEAATELVMERVHDDPETYKDLVNGMYEGEYRHADLVTMIEIDDKLGVDYRNRAHELVGEFYKSQDNDGKKATIKNFQTMQTELDRQIKEEEKKEGFDPNKLRILKRTRRHVARTLTSLAFFAR